MRRNPPRSGYHSPSSGDSPEKIYASPSDDDDEDREWYSETPPRRSLTAAEIREFEEELDALSSHSSDPEGPEDPHKRSKGYAPRLVAIGKYPSDDEEVLVIDETGARRLRFSA